WVLDQLRGHRRVGTALDLRHPGADAQPRRSRPVVERPAGPLMASARVVVTDHAFDSVDTERAVAAELGADFSEHQCRSEAETIEAVRGANAVLVNFAPITAAVLAELAPSAIVVRYGIGYDNVDVEAARAAGVAVANVPDYGGETVADHAVALLLTLLRRIPTYDRMIKTDGWCKPADVGPIRALSETTVGLVGSGRIGLAVA